MRIFITLDYELFLGTETGTPQNCLIRPMDALNLVSEKYGFRYVIFVDAAYLLRLRQLKDEHAELDKDFTTVSNHIRQLAQLGHDIQLHFHPQWLYSNYIEGRGWELKRQPYKLSDMGEEDAFNLFHQAKTFLEEMVGHNTSAFRAGGYCLTSFARYKDLFRKEGITIDSSVARGMYEATPIHAYDYRHVPEKQIYLFENDVCKENKEGAFMELSISTVHWSGIHYMTKVRPQMASYKPQTVFADGKSVVDGDGKSKSPMAKIIKFIMPYNGFVSIDGIRSCQLNHIYEEALARGWQEMVLIGHPKLASDASIKNLEAFLAMGHNNIYCTTKDL